MKNSDIGHLESEIGMLKSEKLQVASEMSAVNQVEIITFIADNDCRVHCQVDMAMPVIILSFNAFSIFCFFLPFLA